MTIFTRTREQEASINAHKIAEIIINSDDKELNKQLAPILEKCAQDSGGLYPSKYLSRVLEKVNEENWTY